MQCNEVIALFVLILASPLNNFYYLAQASNSYWLDIFVPMSSFSHSPSRENMIQTEEKRLCLVVFWIILFYKFSLSFYHTDTQGLAISAQKYQKDGSGGKTQILGRFRHRALSPPWLHQDFWMLAKHQYYTQNANKRKKWCSYATQSLRQSRSLNPQAVWLPIYSPFCKKHKRTCDSSQNWQKDIIKHILKSYNFGKSQRLGKKRGHFHSSAVEHRQSFPIICLTWQPVFW